MRKLGRVLAYVGPLLVGTCAAAPVLPAQGANARIPNITVWDEADQRMPLSEALRRGGGGPAIVLPLYTRCGASCPVLTKKLEKETAGITVSRDYRVLLFSFDPTETGESLRKFREQEGVPRNWMLVRTDAQEIQNFVDFFRYRVMTEGGLLVHPNEIFLLDRGLNWRLTLIGEDWDAAKLESDLTMMESRGIGAWAAMNPAKVAAMGIIGLFGSCALALGWMVSRKPDGGAGKA